MGSIRHIKRHFLIRLMTVLGFGGMAAFCMSSCQSTSSNSDKQPKQETNAEVVPEQSTSDADSSSQDNNVQTDTPNADAVDTFFPESDYEMPVKKYGIPSPISPEELERFDENGVPIVPEIPSVPATPNDSAANSAPSDDEEQIQNLKAEYTEEDLNKPLPQPEQPLPVKKYGIQKPPPPRPPVTKYGVLPPKRYGVMR